MIPDVYPILAPGSPLLSLDYIEKDPELQWVGNANELNAVSYFEAIQSSPWWAWETWES